MKIKNKKMVLLIFSIFISICIPNIIFAEELPQKVEVNSEIKHGPFNTKSLDLKLQQIGLDYTENLEAVDNYESLKDTIYTHMKNYEKSFEISYKGDTSDLKNDISSILDEILEEDHYLYGAMSNYMFSFNGYVNDVIINLTVSYHTNKTQENFVDNKVRRIVDEIIDPDMTDFQKVKAINDWIVNNTKYSEETSTSPHAAYTLFNEGKGVCQAYALATYKLLEEVGIESKYVTGQGKGINHGWNLIKLDGEWYHLDTTWNDPISLEGRNILTYKYFLISDSTIFEDHQMDNRSYPRATNKKYEFMREIKNPIDLDNSMYYILYKSENDYKLYKLDLYTMKKTRLTDNNVQHIAGYGDWIYYSNYSNGGYLYKVKIDGTENIELNQEYSKDIFIKDSYLYYSVNDIKKKILIGSIGEEDSDYLEWEEKINVPSNKEWKIKFNYPIDKSKLDNKNIYIKDSEGNIIENTNLYFNNDKTVSIQPSKKYDNGVYYLYIENIKSITGKKLKKDVKMKFTVNQ